MPKNTKDEIAIMYSNYKVSLLSEKTDGETSVVELNVEDESGHIMKQVSHLTWKNNKWIVID